MSVAFSPATDAYYTAEEARRQAEFQNSIAESIAAVAAGVLAIVLADRMFDIAEDAIEKEYEIRDRILDAQQKYVDHWTNVDLAQKSLVCGQVFGLGAPGANYTGVLSDISIQANGTASGADRGISSLNERNRVDCGERGCVTEAQMMGPVAAANAAHYVFRHQERRRYDFDDEYRRAASGVARSLETKPDQAFALLGNAASLYGTIGQSASAAASSAASVAGGFFGYAAGALS